MSPAEVKPRGAGGRFISQSAVENLQEKNLPDLIHKSSKMTGALKDIREEAEEEELDEPILSVKVNNPFSRVLKWLNLLRKKQTTTFTFRLGVPLIALPVLITAFAAVFFGLGKITTKTEGVITTQNVQDYPISRAGILKIVGVGQSAVYYLILPSGEALLLKVPENLALMEYDTKRILASGRYYAKDQVIVVDKIAGLEILPSTPTAVPTLIPPITPTEALAATPEPSAPEYVGDAL